MMVMMMVTLMIIIVTIIITIIVTIINTTQLGGQRQSFLPIKFQTQRQNTSSLNFLMLLSPDMFKYLNFDYKYFKPSKILIFEWSVNFTDQISVTQMTMTDLFTDQISDAMTKHFLFEFLDVIEPRHV